MADLSDEVIYSVIAKNDVPELERMIKAGLPLDSYIWSPDGQWHASLLSVAASEGAVDAVRALLARGASVICADDAGQTALHFAACADLVEVAEMLVAAGAYIEAKTDAGVTPIIGAAQKGKVQMIELLVRLGANPSARVVSSRNATALHWAASSDCADVIRALGKAGADLNAADSAGETPLHWAAIEEKAQATQALIELGAILDVEESSGCTALYQAVGKQDIGVCRLLVEAGADICHLPASGSQDLMSPFQNAIEIGWLEGVRFMAEVSGIDPLQEPYEGYVPDSLSCRERDDMQELLRSLATAREVRLSLLSSVEGPSGAPAPSNKGFSPI